jgi:predicted aminopeptidase
VVEHEGLQRWLGRAGQAAELERHVVRRERQRQASELMVATRQRLAALYGQPLAPESMRGQKAAEFARLRAALAAGGHPATGEFNNARLAAVATYERCVPALRRQLEQVGGDLPAFYAEMRRLAGHAQARAGLCPRG